MALVISGILTSSIYAVLAVGFSLIFSVGRIIHLAYTAFYAAAAYIIYSCSSLLGYSLPLSLAISLVSTVILGIVTYKLFLERIREHETSVLLATVAIALIFQELLLWRFGSEYIKGTLFFPGAVEFLGTKLSYQSLILIGTVIALFLAVWLFLQRTRLGVAIRATAQDREVVELLGIDGSRMCLVAIIVGMALAAVAGAVAAPLLSLHPYMWLSPLVMVIAIVVLGGLGSIKGALIGAFIIGFTQTLLVFLVPMGAFLKEAVAMAIIIAILLAKPEGLFGIVFEEERL